MGQLSAATKLMTVAATATFNQPIEIVAIHYLNTTAGVGRVDISNGESNEEVVMGAGVEGGTDKFEPAQPLYLKKLVVTFVTGTGLVSIMFR